LRCERSPIGYECGQEVEIGVINGNSIDGMPYKWCCDWMDWGKYHMFKINGNI
jgi:hypothetical protein